MSTRRRILHWLTVLGMVAAGGALPGRSRSWARDIGGDRVRTWLVRPDTAARLGRRCLACRLVRADVARLRAELEAGGLPQGPAEARRRWLRRAIRRDFEEGRVRILDGWVVAETEVGVWALAALEPTGPTV